MRCYGFCYFVRSIAAHLPLPGHEYASGSLRFHLQARHPGRRSLRFKPGASEQGAFERCDFGGVFTNLTRELHTPSDKHPLLVFSGGKHGIIVLNEEGSARKPFFDSGFPHGKRDGFYDSTIKDTWDDVFGASFVADDRGDRVRRCELHLL